MPHDVVIIGAGISGLVDAILMAETGRSVVVIEQHTIPGGYLQQFKRKQTVFDVGFHYMGSTAPGRPMRQFLEHLKIWPKLTILPFPDDNAIEVRRDDHRFAYPSRFARFRDSAVATWPHERDAIESFCDEVDTVCAKFKWFALARGVDYQHPLDMKLSEESFAEFAATRFEDPWLIETLDFQTFNLGLFADEIPWVKHVLAFRSNFDVTCRIDGGGGALVEALVARGKELGVEYRFRTPVTRFECQRKNVRAVTTEAGDRYEAELFIAACHPKPILRCIDDADLKPVFKQRVFDLKDSRGAVQVFLRLSAPPTSLGASCVMLNCPDEESKSPSLSTILITNPTAVETAARGGPRLEAMTYMGIEPFEEWRGSDVFRRGTTYDRLKTELAERIVGMIARVAPEVPDLVTDVYASTPLTDQWYTKNESGSVFGISHDITQQGMRRPMPRMRLRNLFFTGHSITMPGICGTFINAFDTCSLLRDDDDLFEAVAT